MAQPVRASFPPDVFLGANYIVRLTAVDPTTGALVSGVTISGVSIFGDAQTFDPPSPLEDVAPLFVPEPVG